MLLCIETTPSIYTLLYRDPFSIHDTLNIHDTYFLIDCKTVGIQV